ncbi:Fic/DOC family protein [Rubrivivax rivuli]|uniref:Fic/DOC family protein n=1 Tax=Rubrivivax rivuli TaxID=1862385 RepID=UPI0013E2983A|nr:Fic family protein [Rubrivivax rivuli]
MSDPYLYPGTEVLQNLLGICDQAQLQEVEHRLSASRAIKELPKGDFSYAHLKAIHWHLFQDVYDWAGDERIVEMVKDDTVFCPSEHITQRMTEIADDLAAEYHLVGMAAPEFAARAAHYLCAVNAAHPFREGNGRTQRAFFAQLAEQAGHRLDFSRVTAAQMREASVAGVHGEESPMAALMLQAVSRAPARKAAIERALQKPGPHSSCEETMAQRKQERRMRTRDHDIER